MRYIGENSANASGCRRAAVNSVGAANRPLIALTGATGFIGQCLLRELPKRGYRLRVLLRRPSVVPMDRRERGRRRPRAAAEHGGGARRRRCGHPFRPASPTPCRACRKTTIACSTPRPRSAWRAPRSAPAPSASSSCPRSAPRRADRGPRPDRGSRAAADRRLWPLEARGGAGPGRSSTSTGSRCGSCWSTAPA